MLRRCSVSGPPHDIAKHPGVMLGVYHLKPTAATSVVPAWRIHEVLHARERVRPLANHFSPPRSEPLLFQPVLAGLSAGIPALTGLPSPLGSASTSTR